MVAILRFSTASCAALLFIRPVETLAANIFGGAQGNGRSAVPKRDVSIILSTSKTSFAADEPVLIGVTMKNEESKKKARVLDWTNPCREKESEDLPKEMSFFSAKTKTGRYAATYLGAVFKRKEPEEKDYLVLEPGEEISCTIELSDYYQFDAKKTDSDYEIQYIVENVQLSSSGKGNGNGHAFGRELEILQSNTLTLAIEPHASSKGDRRNLRSRELQTGQTTFNGCDASQRSALIEARSLALAASIEVVDRLVGIRQTGSSAECPRYEEWFGALDATRHEELEDGYVKVRDDLEGKNIKFDCTCTSGSYAYVYTNQHYDIYLCSAFWPAAMTGYNSKMGTVIHEISHFNIVAGTDDFAYGASACRDLADNSPEKAINNADNHEYMAENDPVLTCAYGTGAPTSSPTPCDGNELIVDLLTDNYPQETSWTITDTCGGEVVATKSSFTQKATSYVDSFCVPDSAYEFTVTDTENDGICCGYGQGKYTITYGGSVVAEGGEFGSTKTVAFGSSSCGDATDPPTRSPTDAPTSNPTSKSPTASPTREQSSNPTRSPTASPSSSPSKPPTSAPTPNQPTTGCPEAQVKIDILTDQYPAETSWTIADECGDSGSSPTIVKTSPAYELPSHQYSETYCLPHSRYTFVISDDPYEDGICCGYGNGGYAVFYEGVEQISGGDFGASESKAFGSCADAPGPSPPTNPPPSPPSGGDITAEFDAGFGVPRCDAVGSSCSSGALLDGVGKSETNPSNTLLDACADGNSGTYHVDESVDAIKVSAVGGDALRAGTVAEVEATVWSWDDGSFDTADFYYAADAGSPVWISIGSVRATANGGNGGETKLSVQYVLPDGPTQAVRVNFRYEGSPSECSGGGWDDADDLVFSVASSDGTSSKVVPDPVLPVEPLSSDRCADVEDRKRCDAVSICQWRNGWGKGCYPK